MSTVYYFLDKYFNVITIWNFNMGRMGNPKIYNIGKTADRSNTNENLGFYDAKDYAWRARFKLDISR